MPRSEGPLVFDDGVYYPGPPVTPVTPEAIGAAKVSLGVRLPVSYVLLLGERDGGALRLRCFPTAFATSWAPASLSIVTI